MQTLRKKKNLPCDLRFGDFNKMTKPYENSKCQWVYLLTIVQAFSGKVILFSDRVQWGCKTFAYADRYFRQCTVIIIHFRSCVTGRLLTTPARTLFISGLKSRVTKLPFLSLKMMVKSGLEFILKLTEPLQSCCCPVPNCLTRLAELAWQLSRYLWRGSVNF